MNTINGNFLERTIPNLKGALVTLNMGNSTSEMNLEDLATTLGVGSGGGGTNPTSTYVPFNNEGTFADSYLINDAANSVLKTVYEGNDIGLKIDFANGYGQLYSNTGSGLFYDGLNSIIGDYTFKNNGTYFLVDDYNTIIQSKYQNIDKGLFLDFANNIYGFGNSTYETSLSFTANEFNLSNRLKIDFTNNNVLYIGDINSSYTQTAFAVDPANSIIETFNSSLSTGLFLDFINLQYKIGDFSTGRQTHLLIDNNNEFFSFYHNTNQKGLKLDFANLIYSFGQLNGGNLTKLEIDDQNQKLILSSNLETTSAGSGAAGKRLKITIGGNDYLIDLITP